MVLFRIYNMLQDPLYSDCKFILIAKEIQKKFDFQVECRCDNYLRIVVVDQLDLRDTRELSLLKNFFKDNFIYHFTSVCDTYTGLMLISKKELIDKDFIESRESLKVITNNKFDLFTECYRCESYYKTLKFENDYSKIREEGPEYKFIKLNKLKKLISDRYQWIENEKRDIEIYEEEMKEIYNSLSDEDKLKYEIKEKL